MSPSARSTGESVNRQSGKSTESVASGSGARTEGDTTFARMGETMRTGTSKLRRIGSAGSAALRVDDWFDYDYEHDYEHEHEHERPGPSPQVRYPKSEVRSPPYSAALIWSQTFVYLALSAPRSSMTSLLARISGGRKMAGLFRISVGEQLVAGLVRGRGS